MTGGDTTTDRVLSRRKSLAPLTDRRAMSPTPPPLAPIGLPDRLGPAVDHVLTEAGDNLVHKVEHIDTMINAHASVVAEGIRPPLEKRNSAMDGIKSLFRSTSQPSIPGLEEFLMTDVRPYSPTKFMDQDPSANSSTGHASTQHNQPVVAAGEDSISAKRHTQAAVTPGEGSFTGKRSGPMRKVHPQTDKPLGRRTSANSDEKQPPVENARNDSATQSSHQNQGTTPPTSRPPSVTRKHSREGVRRNSIGAAIVDGVQGLARSASKMLDALDETRQAKVAELMEKDVMVLNETQLAQMQQRSAYPFTISVNSTFRHWWEVVITVCTAYVIITTPIKVGFNVSAEGISYAIDVIVDLLYLMEVTINFFTSYIDETTGEEVKDLPKIRQNYLYGFFVMDALSSFPSSLIGSGTALLTLIKILKVARVYKVSKSGLFKAVASRVNRSMNPSLLRMLNLTFIFLISQHFIACTYYYISLNQNQVTSWQPTLETRDSSLIQQYVHAIYFAIMVTTANDVNPTTTTEKLFTSVMLFVGIVINASIIGSAANLLSNLDKAEIARKNQMDSINDYMRFKKVPLALQDKIRRYYDYALSSRITDPTETLFADLPDRLKLSLRLNLHDEFIRKVPLFRVCSNAGVIAIIQCLKQVVVMPHEVIIAQGEVANEFYFIKSGRVSLCVRTSAQVVPLGNLGEGSFFGEASLLTGEPQQAEVKSESITELAFLTKLDFTAIIDKFPTFYLAVRRISENRMQTAQNVQRMTKMQRRQSNPHVPAMARKITMKRAAEAILQASKVRQSVRSAGRKVPEHPALAAASNSLGLSQRFSSSRRNSAGGLFSANYLEHMSLGQARHLSTIRAMDTLNIESSADDPMWN